MNAQPQKLRDAVLYRAEDGTRREMLAFFNLISKAITYGMVMGSARTALGTDNPAGPSIPGDSLYYQMLHAYSAFDSEFQAGLFTSSSGAPLPREVAVLAGRFPQALVDRLANEEIEEVALAHRVACTLAPSLKPFEFRRLADEDYAVDKKAQSITVAPAIREALWRGTATKLRAVDEIACKPSCAAPLAEKLLTMASAYAPLCTTFSGSFDRKAPAESFTRLVVYAPALHTLHAQDADAPETWFLERGVARFALPTPVQVAAANITHVGYLRDADRHRQQGLRFEVRRDFLEPQRATLILGFGRLLQESSDDLLGFDCDDHRDALTVSLKAKLPIASADGERVRIAKERFNRAASGYDVEARIHQLTMHLTRGTPRRRTDEETLLRPQFSRDDSRISFRVERHTDSPIERVSLQAAGFTCELDRGRGGSRCWRDFWTWRGLREFFTGAGTLSNAVIRGRERLLGEAVGVATQTVLDQSIQSIERALDDEIARVVSSYLERYATAREIVAGRLHSGLFTNATD